MAVLKCCMVLVIITRLSVIVKCSPNSIVNTTDSLNTASESRSTSTIIIQSDFALNVSDKTYGTENGSINLGDQMIPVISHGSEGKNNSTNVKKKTVRQLIVFTDDDEKAVLRSHHNKPWKRKQAAKVLLYKETDDTGKEINKVTMKNLDDVAAFFRLYLGTIICYGECEEG